MSDKPYTRIAALTARIAELEAENERLRNVFEANDKLISANNRLRADLKATRTEVERLKKNQYSVGEQRNTNP